MTQISINTQIETIRSVTQEVLKTKESARQFLEDAGIIKDKKRAGFP
jgi:hypothetical protein